jgi:hypothetical protein
VLTLEPGTGAELDRELVALELALALLADLAVLVGTQIFPPCSAMNLREMARPYTLPQESPWNGENSSYC